MAPANKYVIIRDDLVQDPVVIISDGLLIGRLRECELLLNHPSVSRAQAGIKLVDGNYYIFSLRSSNPIKLNGKPVEENEALAAGDVLEVRPFIMAVDQNEEGLTIRVSLRIGKLAADEDLSSSDVETSRLGTGDVVAGKGASAKRVAPLPGNRALDIFWDKRIREAGKMVRPSVLFPRAQRKAGKAQFFWAPTTDLARRWPISFLLWGGIAVGVLSLAAAYWYTNAYAPAPLSLAHAKAQMDHNPPIAVRANDGACTTCHNRSGMEASCSRCHQAAAFTATVIKQHADAGIGCVTCHAEHQGPNFQAAEAAIVSCAECHTAANSDSYNGRRVSTPHGGTFGYPVVNGEWKWRLADEEWAQKELAVVRRPIDDDNGWRSKQFHALHLYRVKANELVPGNAAGNLSCSSCHNSFDPIDRESPRKTCGLCHNGNTVKEKNQVLIAGNKPNCISCHVQHIKSQRHWNPDLLAME